MNEQEPAWSQTLNDFLCQVQQDPETQLKGVELMLYRQWKRLSPLPWEQVINEQKKAA